MKAAARARLEAEAARHRKDANIHRTSLARTLRHARNINDRMAECQWCTEWGPGHERFLRDSITQLRTAKQRLEWLTERDIGWLRSAENAAERVERQLARPDLTHLATLAWHWVTENLLWPLAILAATRRYKR